MDLRKLIIERIRSKGVGTSWVIDVYHHLIEHGASPDDAIEAMSLFVDECTSPRAPQGKAQSND